MRYMRFCDIPGNEELKRALVGMADSGRVAHAMLLYENPGCGAFPLAVAYLQYLACPHRHDGDSCGECPTCNKISKLIHPDIHFVFPTNTGSKSGSLASKDIVSDIYMKDFRAMAVANPYFLESDLSEAIGIEGKVGDISVGEAKSIIDKLSLSSVENGYKAVVLFQPEKMNPAAANKMLKIVEEPPEKTIFLFITQNPDRVMQTIFSRCQSSRVLPLSREQVRDVLTERFSIGPDEALSLSGICGGSVGEALQAVNAGEDRERYREIFSSLMEGVVTRNLLGALDAADAAAALDSREKQKAFCTFASDCLRKVFVIQKGLPGIAYAPESGMDFINMLASRLPQGYCYKVQDYLDKAVELIGRNVNQKIVFCDLADRMFLIYDKR